MKAASVSISLTNRAGVSAGQDVFARAAAAFIPAVTRSLNRDRSQFGHGANDGGHGPANRAGGIDLILDADES